MDSENEDDDEVSDNGKRSRPELVQAILTLVNDPKYRAAKPRVITSLLGLPQSDLVEVRRTIKRMVRSGQLKFGSKHMVIPNQPPSARVSENRTTPKVIAKKVNEIVGTYRKTSQAFGFVTPIDYFAGDRAQDIFIPPRKELDASDGDKVKVRLQKSSRAGDSRLSGQVVEVVERRTYLFVGTYKERGESGVVFVDGDQFTVPIYVGDAKSKNCRSGDKVVVEMVHFPKDGDSGEAVVVEILGPRGKPGVDTQTVIVEFNLPGEFPKAALDEAHRQAEMFDEKKIANRTDFTRKTIVTIDPKTARDFDDAISLEPLENGNWELGVHIADVAQFVQRGTALDDEAFVRGNSVYLPDIVIPMLPEVISNNLASLQPQRVRYTMSVVMEITPEGQTLHAEWHRGAIKSAHRFNYEEIDDYLKDAEPWREKLTPEVFELVRSMHELAMPMRKRRMARGSIDLSLPEVSIDLDNDGKVAGAHVELYTESHQVIEEFMLAANEAIAQKLFDLELFYLRRIHEPPSEKKLRDLTEFVRHVGIPCESLQSRFEIKRVLAASNEMPERQAIHFAVLRSMQKAIYSPKESGHYALASQQYCHFTSPIRRYPDLIIHRMVADLIDGKRPMADFDKLEQWGQHCSETEQRAEQAERELIKLKLLNFLSEKIGMQLDVFVTGVEAFGVFVQGIELPAEGLLPLDNLPPDQYLFDGVTRTLQGRKAGNEFRLGDRMKVVVDKVDPDRRLLQFAMSKESSGTSGRQRPSRRGSDDQPRRPEKGRGDSRSSRDQSFSRSGRDDSRRKGRGGDRDTRSSAGIPPRSTKRPNRTERKLKGPVRDTSSSAGDQEQSKRSSSESSFSQRKKKPTGRSFGSSKRPAPKRDSGGSRGPASNSKKPKRRREP